MDSDTALYIGKHTLETALLIAAPVLITCMATGFTITLIQAVTSVRDMSLTIVPKLLSVGAVLLLCGGWMLEILLRFTTETFTYIEQVGH